MSNHRSKKYTDEGLREMARFTMDQLTRGNTQALQLIMIVGSIMRMDANQVVQEIEALANIPD